MAQTCQKKETPTIKSYDSLEKCDAKEPGNPVPITEIKNTFFPVW